MKRKRNRRTEKRKEKDKGATNETRNRKFQSREVFFRNKIKIKKSLMRERQQNNTEHDRNKSSVNKVGLRFSLRAPNMKTFLSQTSKIGVHHQEGCDAVSSQRPFLATAQIDQPGRAGHVLSSAPACSLQVLRKSRLWQDWMLTPEPGLYLGLGMSCSGRSLPTLPHRLAKN